VDELSAHQAKRMNVYKAFVIFEAPLNLPQSIALLIHWIGNVPVSLLGALTIWGQTSLFVFLFTLMTFALSLARDDS
jgi:hypothetical protein